MPNEHNQCNEAQCMNTLEYVCVFVCVCGWVVVCAMYACVYVH